MAKRRPRWVQLTPIPTQSYMFLFLSDENFEDQLLWQPSGSQGATVTSNPTLYTASPGLTYPITRRWYLLMPFTHPCKAPSMCPKGSLGIISFSRPISTTKQVAVLFPCSW